MKLQLSIIATAAIFQVGTINAQSIGEEIGKGAGAALAGAVGGTAEKVGDAVNMGMGGVQAEGKVEIEQDVTTKDVTTDARGKDSVAEIVVGNSAGVKAGKDIKIKQKIKTEKLTAQSADGGKAKIIIGNTGRN